MGWKENSIASGLLAGKVATLKNLYFRAVHKYLRKRFLLIKYDPLFISWIFK